MGAVVRINPEGEKEAALFTWGFQPGWSKRAWINARSETAFESRAFAPAARKRRCLVAASGWYEWQGPKAPKQPYVFHLDGFRPFAFAGIWTARETDEGWAGSFAILTRPATDKLEWIHGRMPVVLDPEHYEAWIAPETSEAMAREIASDAFGEIETYAVSTYVNKPANNDAECIRLVET